MSKQRKDLTDDVMLAVIRAARKLRAERNPGQALTWPADLLPGFHPKVVEAKMAQLNAAGVIDYGVTLRSAWIVGEDWR